MSELALPLSLLVAGFASGLHCAGMCGGIAAGFSVLHKDQLWKRQLAFNLGRLTTYAAAGAAVGAVGAGTLPWLLAAGIATARLRGWLKLSAVRIAGGAMLIGTGAWGAAHASGLSDTVRQSLLCF